MGQPLSKKLGSLWENPYKLFLILSRRGVFSRMKDERYLRLLYHGVMGRPLHLDPPVLYSEKIQWLKLHDKNPIYPALSDKVAVREFVRDRAGDAYLTNLLGVWDNPDQIDFSTLPDRFVLKCNHDSGSYILCKDKSKFDTQAAIKTLKKLLKKDYATPGREWPYRYVPRRVLAEEYLYGDNESRVMDFKFFCFHGKAQFVLVRKFYNDREYDNYTFLPDFSEYQIYRYKKPEAEHPQIPKPPRYEEMRTIAERLSAGFTHVRVDLYDTSEGVKFGEMTLYNASGLSKFLTLEGDRWLGEHLRLENENSL